METLPEEVYLYWLLPYLQPADLGMMACANRSMRVLADNNEAWRILYIMGRKKSFSITPTSQHRRGKNWYACANANVSPSPEVWVAAGMPCTKLSHYVHSTIVENTKPAINYHNFKRAFAKATISRIGKFDVQSERHLEELLWRYTVYHSRITELKRQIEQSIKRRSAPAKFKTILALPPSTPPHMRAAKRARK